MLQNMMTTHNDWRSMGITLEIGGFAPVQLDANMGLVAAINEMLVYSEPGYLKLLSACTNPLGTGEIHNFTFYDGVLDMKWDLNRRELTATITPARDIDLKVELPSEWKQPGVLHLEKGVAYTIKIDGEALYV